MKTIGLVGGMSRESTAHYCRPLNVPLFDTTAFHALAAVERALG
jgi:aspartate/glutamate racemase